MRRSTPWLVLACASMFLACAAPSKPPPDQAFEVRVTEASGTPVEGAAIVLGTSVVASTNREGVASMSLTGREGDLIDLGVRCPNGYESPPDPLRVRWITVRGGAPSHLVHCRKMSHRLIVVVRANGGPNLPISHLGHVIATTDAAGAAIMAFDVVQHERIELTMSTESFGKEKVTPRNPTAFFEASSSDDVQLFDVNFVRPKPRPARGGPARTGPARI